MKIYFSNVLKTYNTGDKRSSPYWYYSKYLKQYDTSIIDISKLTTTDIHSQDFIIIGGGGILNSGNRWNTAINYAFQHSDNVVIWGAGFNNPNPNPNLVKLNLDKSIMLGIRDYNHPLYRFIPCASCKSIYFDIPYSIKRKIGIIKHHSRRLILDDSLKEIPSITNQASMKQIIRFIGESECIISNSYHALYWSSLLKKKTGRLDCNVDSRFRYCMYQYQEVNTIEDIDRCRVSQLTDDDIQYFRWLNDDFFKKVKMKIEYNLS